MSDLEQFFTREKANEGIKLPLSLPDGSPSGHWLMIRHIDCDEFRKKDFEMKRRLVYDSKKTSFDGVTAEQQAELLSVLIASWSFSDVECNDENKIQLLIEAPQIADEINRVSVINSLFFSNSQSD